MGSERELAVRGHIGGENCLNQCSIFSRRSVYGPRSHLVWSGHSLEENPKASPLY